MDKEGRSGSGFSNHVGFKEKGIVLTVARRLRRAEGRTAFPLGCVNLLL